MEEYKWAAIVEYDDPDGRKEQAANDTIYTRSEAADIVELFEDMLEQHDVTIPSPDDYERGNDSGPLYGSTYYSLLEAVEERLVEIASRARYGAKIVVDVFP